MKIFDEPVSLEQALREAGEDWTPVPTPLYAPDKQNHLERLPGRIGLRRSDTDRFIPGVTVSNSYTIVPVRDAFLIVDQLVGAGEAVIQRVGSQYGGRFQWLSARLPRAILLQLDGQTDRLEKSLLFCTSHDTSSSVVVRLGLHKNDLVQSPSHPVAAPGRGECTGSRSGVRTSLCDERLDPQESAKHRAWRRFEAQAPNPVPDVLGRGELWQMDFKGHFALVRSGRCHPLTVLDDHSRFCLGL